MFGQGGAGKTTLAANAQDSEHGRNVIIFDAEGGAEAIANRGDIEVVEIFSYNDFKKAFKWLVDNPKQTDFKTIVFDNLIELAKMCLEGITGNAADQVEIQEWGAMSREIIDKVRDSRDILVRQQGRNVIYCAWDDDIQDPKTKVIKKTLALNPALRKEYPGVVTWIGHVNVTSKPDRRMLDMAPGPRTIAKWRRAPGDVAHKIPYKIEYGLDHMPLADILNTIKGGEAWPDKYYGKIRQDDDD